MSTSISTPAASAEALLLDELRAADAQGERVIGSLWLGDSFLYRGLWHIVTKLQRMSDPDQVYIVAVDEDAFVHHYVWNLYLIFPCMITDEHAKAENPEVW